MLKQTLLPSQSNSHFYPALALLGATTIFLIDTFTPLDIAIAVLYVAVIMLSATFLSREGLLAISATCIFLTIASFAIVHWDDLESSAMIRCLVSLSAIMVTTLLALKNNKATHDLRDQAALLDLTHDAIYVRNIDDVIVYWNVGAEELYGWKSEEAVGRSVLDLLKTKFPKPIKEIMADLADANRWQGEIRQTKRDGTEVVVASRWSQQRDDKGRPIATMVTNNDITDQQRAEDDLHKAQGELAHVTRLTTLGELTASIAHEVNQPLAAVVTNGEAALRWMQRDVPDLKEVHSSLERMISNGRRASDVIARLRALTRKTDLIRAPLDANELLEDVLLLVERELISKNVALKLNLANVPLPVLGDRVQMQQAIINLAVNAVQAMSTVADRPHALHIRTHIGQDENAQKTVTIEISDNGPGIDPAVIGNLFTAFYTTKSEGMGMGLSICRSIIESHGGKIVATSEPGQGATFSVHLPVREDAA
ncbi:nitrogen regulation protein NR(II) [Hyphomicrobium sp.]|jgi:PAS domain S-box-containing protein|uniref:two-component system sensor histidine kinase NtrB n=1 Tax=Hyphomicrobium sp. TaxID=82 RepID=UPI00356A0F30